MRRFRRTLAVEPCERSSKAERVLACACSCPGMRNMSIDEGVWEADLVLTTGNTLAWVNATSGGELLRLRETLDCRSRNIIVRDFNSRGLENTVRYSGDLPNWARYQTKCSIT